METTDQSLTFSDQTDSILTVMIAGEIDHSRAAPLRRLIDEELMRRHPKHLRLDMQGVGFMDSSGLGLILGRYTKACQLGIDFSVQNPSDCVKKMLTLAGTDKLIAVVCDPPAGKRKESTK